MEYQAYSSEYFEHLFQMTSALFPSTSQEEIRQGLEKDLVSEKQQTFLAIENHVPVGFINATLRTDYVEGATSSPVGYIEGVYVKPEFRHRGVARMLYKIAERWARDSGCMQMGSDTWEWNKASIEFHLKLGFKEEDILVHFIKDIRAK